MGNDIGKKRAINGRIFESTARDLAGDRWDPKKWEDISDDHGDSISLEAWETLVAANEAWEQVSLLSDLGATPAKVAQDSTAREGHVICAQACRECKLWDMMCEEMAAVVVDSPRLSLSIRERTLLVQAFKESVNWRRRAWAQLVERLKSCIGEEYLARGIIQVRVNELQREIEAQCWKFIKLLESYLLQNATIDEERCFFFKLKGDFYRYLIELEHAPNICELALDSYSKAYMIATDYLHEVDPTRLGTALNYAVFLDKHCDKKEQALSLARKTYEDAIDSSLRLNETDGEVHELLNLLKAYITSAPAPAPVGSAHPLYGSLFK